MPIRFPKARKYDSIQIELNPFFATRCKNIKLLIQGIPPCPNKHAEPSPIILNSEPSLSY